jgi:hypothetical protein
LFLLSFVFLDERGTGGENCRERKKEAAHDGTMLPRDQPRENGGTAKEKSQGVFISGLPESRELDGHSHQGYFSNSSQTPDESANQSRKVAMLAGAACQRPRIMRLLQTQAYRRKAPAPAAIERVSIAAYHFPSGNTVRLSVARPTEGAAPNKSGKTLWFQHVT